MGSSKIHCLKAKDGSKVWTFQAKGVFFVKPIIIQDSILIINSSDPWNPADKTGVFIFHKLQKRPINKRSTFATTN